MAIVVTSLNASEPTTTWLYRITGLVAGANIISLPTPPQPGSFPPLADWTPAFIQIWPFMPGAIGALVTADLQTITNVNGTISFTLYSAGSTNAIIEVN